MNATINIVNDSTNFDNWMLLQNNNKPKLEIEDNWSATSGGSTSSSTWFEPLETLLSSASSPSTDDQFSPYSNSSFPTVFVKEEELDNDDHHVLFDTPSITTTTTTDINSDTKQQPILKKNRTTRKRLTAHQKQAHNKIEKRYRININSKIAKLQQIIPWVATEQTSFDISGNNNNNNKTTSNNSTKLNKSMILEKAVDYILYLKNNERLHDLEVMRLRNELETLKSQK